MKSYRAAPKRGPQSLRAAFNNLLLRYTALPIFVTIQPNFAWSHAKMVNRGDGPTMVKRLISDLFYALDRDHTGCPKPAHLPPNERFNGFVVVEKPSTNPHAHILISCTDAVHQHAQALALFELLDNVEERLIEHDKAWAQDAWHQITTQSKREKSRAHRTYSLLTELAPAGTAMVQPILGASDHNRVVRYMTKTCYERKTRDADFDFFELRDFFPALPEKLYARPWRGEGRDPSCRVIDPDKTEYRVSGRGILR